MFGGGGGGAFGGVSYADGSSGAPTGSAQLPALLNGYAVRPPWMVAGVDYAVGCPTNLSLVAPTVGNIPAGSHIDTTFGNVLVVTGNNVVVSGFDFTGNGGWCVNATGNNCTVQNNKFLVQATAKAPIIFDASCVGGSILYNNIDGNNGTNDRDGQGQLIKMTGAPTGTYTIRYNFLKSVYSDFIDFGNSAGGASQAFIMQFNLLLNGGMGADQLGHPDWVQMGFNDLNSCTIAFNTFVQNTQPLQGGCQGVGIGSTAGGGPFTISGPVTVTNNTAIATSAALAGEPTFGGITWAFDIANNQFTGGATAVVSNNYGDTTGMKGSSSPTNPAFCQFEAAVGGSVTISGNIRMTDGGTMTLHTQDIY